MSVRERLLRDERGIAMGLAIVLVVVVGVMGAGLLVFVRNDLQAVIQANQGQEAFEAADAGVQAARRELLSDACPQSYDGSSEKGDECGESEWSHWSESDEGDYEGKKLDFDGKKIRVEIRHLPFPGEGACADGSTSDADCAPVESAGEEEKREFFRVESLGISENGDARRRIEAIFYTEPAGIPRAYYSRKTVTLKGNACVSGASVFSSEDIEFSGNGGCENGEDKDFVSGKDVAYGDWRNSFNSTERDSEQAGFGAVGKIEEQLEGRDYDASTSPEFVEEPTDEPQPEDEITFPFAPGAIDEGLIGLLREIARDQGNYHEVSGDSFTIDTSTYPASSDHQTVYFVEFTKDSGNARYSIKKPDNPPEGTIVVVNGNLDTTSGSGEGESAFEGAIVIHDPEGADLTYKQAGNFTLNGYVSVDGFMEISGAAASFGAGEVANRPGFYGVELWSWRELYE